MEEQQKVHVLQCLKTMLMPRNYTGVFLMTRSCIRNSLMQVSCKGIIGAFDNLHIFYVASKCITLRIIINRQCVMQPQYLQHYTTYNNRKDVFQILKFCLPQTWLCRIGYHQGPLFSWYIYKLRKVCATQLSAIIVNSFKCLLRHMHWKDLV